MAGWCHSVWWGHRPDSTHGRSADLSGIFGIPAGFIGIIVGTMISPAPSKEVQELVDHVRYPSLEGDTMNTSKEAGGAGAH